VPLGRDDHAVVRGMLDALVASGQLEYERVEDLCADCEWPAAPLEAYRLTRWGEAPLAALGTGVRAAATPSRSAGTIEHAFEHAEHAFEHAEHAFEHAIELGMQAFDKTGDAREAIIQALTRAAQGGWLEGQAVAASG
jgi:hypothetical protein